MYSNMVESNWIRDFVEVAIANLVRIESNLRKLGYDFDNKEGPIKQIGHGTNQELNRIRQQYNCVPEFLVAWYDRVEYVDFTQHMEQLLEPSDHPVAGLGLNCTLVIKSLESVCELQTMVELDGFKCKNVDGKDFIPFGSYSSNSTPKGVWLPDSDIDPVIYDDGAGPIRMSREIAHSINSGGFPFWASMFSKRRFSSPILNVPKYHEIKPELFAGIVAMK